MEKNMVNVYFFGKKYSVPAELTIMTAMEYAGYTLKRGCGCRHGFCGACATIYRIKGENELKTCLAFHIFLFFVQILAHFLTSIQI